MCVVCMSEFAFLYVIIIIFFKYFYCHTPFNNTNVSFMSKSCKMLWFSFVMKTNYCFHILLLKYFFIILKAFLVF